jgi:hypothetical protein
MSDEGRRARLEEKMMRPRQKEFCRAWDFTCPLAERPDADRLGQERAAGEMYRRIDEATVSAAPVRKRA